MSSQVKYRVHAYWGVNIRELHIFLWRPWSDLRDACLRGDFLRGYYQYPDIKLERTSHSDQTITLKLEGPALDLGTPPRLCYPLVILLYRNDIEDSVHPDETVALINVVHIKDTVCTLPTNILAQYLKQANGQLSCLKQLYLATGNPGGYEEGQIPLAVAEPVEGDLVPWVVPWFVQQMRILRYGILRVNSSALGEEYMPIQSSSKTQSSHGPLYNWLHSWDDRLTDFLGFQR
ncbi:hypothetical protein NQ314_004706 [Rhamnusium bicolor]|uniref:Uncharacterized protein n=1 Tax=Rhamnusium bicolor TaxID=1586634 RepID=A0AAV8ZIU8_9CUCU|nr:hypothetical protein NQ314_004706 [Rhamnusium bicolor]